MKVITVDFLFGDAGFEETKHPRGKSGSGKGGQFVKKGQEGGGAQTPPEARRPRSPEVGMQGKWDPSGSKKGINTNVPENAEQMEYGHARAVGDNPKNYSTEHLKKALTLLKLQSNHVDRAHGRRIMTEMLLRGVPPGKVGVKPPKQEVKVEPKPEPKEEPKPEPRPEPEPEPKEEPQPQPAKKQPAKATPQLRPPQGNRPDPHIFSPSNPANVKAKDLSAAIADKKGAEQDYQRNSFPHASERMVNIMRNMPTMAVDNKGNENGWSCYHTASNRISMAGGSEQDPSGTWRHEYGHAIDDQFRFTGPDSKDPTKIKWRYGSYRYEAQRRIEGDDFAKRMNKTHPLGNPESPQEQRAKTEQTLQEYGLDIKDFQRMRNTSMIADPLAMNLRRVLEGSDHPRDIVRALMFLDKSTNAKGYSMDFLGAMTNNRVGFGHSNEYYKAYEFNSTEMFANYVNMTEGEHGKWYKMLLHKAAPQSCAGFEFMLDTISARQPMREVGSSPRGYKLFGGGNRSRRRIQRRAA